MSTPVNHLGGKCPCIPFFIGGQMSEGENTLKQLTVMCCTIGQNHFIHHEHLGYNMTKPATWLTAQNLPRLITLIADLVKELTLTFHIFIF